MTMAMQQENDLSYQKLTWNLFKECLFQPLFYGPLATGIFLAFIDISFSYIINLLLGRGG